MPKLPKDFSKGLIYKLCCKDTTIKEIYVGSTTNFTQRKRKHKSDCNKPNCKKYNLKVYKFINENGGWFNFDMVLIEYYPCNTELELGRREDHWKQELKSVLNSISPHIYETQKEYKEANKEKIAEYCKKYWQTNRERLVKHKKKWYEANKEVLAEKKKKYNETSKEKNKEKISCECGCVISRRCMKKHKTSAKHISMLKQINSGINIPNNFCETCECGCVVSRGKLKRHIKTAKHISMLKQNPLDQDTQGSSV